MTLDGEVEKRRAFVLSGVLAACVVHAFGTRLLSAHPTALNIFSTAGWTLASLVAGLRCFRVAAAQGAGRSRIAWRAFGVGSLAWCAGIVWWAVGEFVLGQPTAVPSVADIGYLSLGPLFALGMLYIQPEPPPFALTLKQVADLGIVLFATALVLVLALYEPLRLTLGTPLRAIVAVAFPVSRFAALFFCLVFLWQHVPDVRRRVPTLLVLALAVLASLAVLYANELLEGPFESGNWFDAGYVLGFALVIWATYEEEWVGVLAHEAPLRPIPLLDPLVPTLGIGSVAVAFAAFYERFAAELLPLFTTCGVCIAALFGLRTYATHRLEEALREDVRRHEQELRTLEQELMHAQTLQAIHSLSASVAHEFRNLIQVMAAGLSLAQHRLQQGGEIQSSLEEVERAVWRANDMTTRLLGLARRGGEHGTRVVRVADTVEQMVGLLRRVLPRNIQVEGPEGDTDAFVEVDEAILEQVLFNLALNARDAMATGGVLRLSQRVEQRLSPKSGKVREFVLVLVSDTGEGIAKELLSRMFEPFFTTKPHGRGTGLGLLLVNNFVREHGGFVEVQSEPGKGTCFTLYLPRVRAKESKTNAPAANAKTS